VAFGIYAQRLGLPVEPAVAVWPLACTVPALLLTAYLVALWPGWRASKVATATVLRTE
jgi:predicted lysophospholipase L1 biosynthesis ABC-type transport system permease subunit